MVGFQNQRIRAANPLEDEFGGVAKIRQEPDLHSFRPQGETDRVLGIVGDGEGFDFKISDGEASTSGENVVVELGFQLAFGSFLGGAVPINGDTQLAGKRGQPGDMVAVLVGDEDAGQGFGHAADQAEALTDLAPAEARVDEKPGFPALKIGTISITTAT